MPEEQFHVSLYIGGLSLGGAAKDVVTFAKEFSHSGHRVDLLLSSKQGVFLPAVPSTIRIIELGGSRALKDLIPLVSYLKKERPDFLISTLGQHNLIALLAKRIAGGKTRVIIREVVLTSVLQHQVRLGKGIRRLLSKKIYPWADTIIAVSEGVARDIENYFGISREFIQVIFGPVVTRDLVEMSMEPVEHPWFVSPTVPIVLGAGQLEIHKDFDTLLHAFSIVKKNRPARLVILGEGTERSNLERLALKLGIKDETFMPGFTVNPFKFMASASVFVLSSPSEGLGNVIIEAMACGTPIVSTDCPGGPAEILEWGRYGHLVPVGNPNALAEAINRMLDYPTSRSLLQHGASRFYSEKIAQDYESLFAGQAVLKSHAHQLPIILDG
jgi:glycosyltransferase involved in cell wall biosynthesis